MKLTEKHKKILLKAAKFTTIAKKYDYYKHSCNAIIYANNKSYMNPYLLRDLYNQFYEFDGFIIKTGLIEYDIENLQLFRSLLLLLFREVGETY